MKTAFPCYWLEIMLSCIKDIIDNGSYYPNINPDKTAKIKTILEKLNKTYVYLNAALDEFFQIMPDIESVFKKP